MNDQETNTRIRPMSTSKVIAMCSVISIFTIWITAYNLENGDVNAMSMYFVVFLFPALIISLGNGLLINTAKKLDSKKLKRIISLAPLPLFTIVAFADDLNLPFLDGSIAFVALIGLVSVGITNIIWNIRLT